MATLSEAQPQRPLQGGCSCGRNKYIVYIPQNSTEGPTVYFDNGHHHRRSQATPLSAWLRIPLSWYHSTTCAYLPDELPSSIRRVYTSPNEQHCKRHFCGFCGTPLSYWSESPASEAEYISLTLGSLTGADLRNLEELGLLPKEATEEVEDNVVIADEVENEGLPWFETLVEGSKLGSMKKSWGRRTDGKYKVEWEIVEWTEGDEGEGEGGVEGGEESTLSVKRKYGEVHEPDSVMEGTH
ncbi:uncharacterized protein PAC_04666 [Phialocephala subalpina]|uniref:CENP-V/GFA domain-containing protein n=1 Tax=Phialocephala subalpina TaxID=576137 RepID=A0A1L7WPT3_9HELO|nr:uncharacterized protein PAC_04666 [Phialocephala subalpina]